MKKSVRRCLSLIDQGASVGVAIQLLLQIEQSPAAALTEMTQILTKKAHASGYNQAIKDTENLLTKKGV